MNRASSKSTPESPQDEFSLFQFWRLPIPNLLPGTNPGSRSTKNKNLPPPEKASPGRRPGDVVTGGDASDIGIPDDDMTGDNSVFREGEGEEGDDYRGDLTDIKDELLAESAEMESNGNKGSSACSEGVAYSNGMCPNPFYPQVSSY